MTQQQPFDYSEIALVHALMQMRDGVKVSDLKPISEKEARKVWKLRRRPVQDRL